MKQIIFITTYTKASMSKRIGWTISASNAWLVDKVIAHKTEKIAAPYAKNYVYKPVPKWKQIGAGTKEPIRYLDSTLDELSDKAIKEGREWFYTKNTIETIGGVLCRKIIEVDEDKVQKFYNIDFSLDKEIVEECLEGEPIQGFYNLDSLRTTEMFVARLSELGFQNGVDYFTVTDKNEDNAEVVVAVGFRPLNEVDAVRVHTIAEVLGVKIM